MSETHNDTKEAPAPNCADLKGATAAWADRAADLRECTPWKRPGISRAP